MKNTKVENLVKVDGALKILPFWSRNTIQSYVSRGLIPCVRIGGRILFDEAELKLFAKSIYRKQKGAYQSK